MRRPLVALMLMAALLLAGCESSLVDRSATVVVSGRVLRSDGSPAGGVPVGLERAPGLGEFLAGTLFVTVTFFTACLADPPPEVCRGRAVRRATTAADGTYSIQLAGRDTQTFFGHAGNLSVSAELPPGPGEAAGAAVIAGFQVQTENLRLPDLQMWQPPVTVAGGRITWQPPPDGAPSYRVVAEDRSRPVWAFDSAGPEVTFDPRILEDSSGSVAVSARTSGTAEGTTLSILRRSARVPYRSTAGPPPSRGRPCTRDPGAAPLARCPLTDGDLSTALPAAATTSTTTHTSTVPSRDSATIDLGGARDVSLVVVRGCTCDVEASADGQIWRAFGRASGFSALTPARAGAARFVRVTGSLTDVREVSVWEEDAASQAPPPGAGPGPAPDPAVPAVPPASPAEPDRSRRGPALAALAALLVAATATAAAAARTRR